MYVGIISLCVVALVLLTYLITIEHALKTDPSYKAGCDLSDTVSCTKAAKSPYGKILGINNSYIGVVFYAGMIMLAFLHKPLLLRIGAFAACAASLYFAHALFFKVKAFCLVCVATYMINVLLFVMTFHF